MLRHKLSVSEISAMFADGLSCSQVVLGQWADELGYDQEEAHRMASAFGGGMFRGDTCGAVTGALVAIGLKYGYSDDSPEKKDILMNKVAQFQKEFIEKMGSTVCRELVGYDFAQDGGLARAAASGRLMTFCPMAVAIALELLDELM